MNDLSLNVLDVAVNSLKANADSVEIYVKFGSHTGFTVVIKDDGEGTEQSFADFLADGGYEGHGLSLMKETCESFGGTLRMESKRGEGTTVTAEFPKAEHKKAENMGDTVMALAANERGAGVIFQAERCGSVFRIDTRTGRFRGKNMTFPENMIKLRKAVENGLKEIIGGSD